MGWKRSVGIFTSQAFLYKRSLLEDVLEHFKQVEASAGLANADGTSEFFQNAFIMIRLDPCS